MLIGPDESLIQWQRRDEMPCGLWAQQCALIEHQTGGFMKVSDSHCIAYSINRLLQLLLIQGNVLSSVKGVDVLWNTLANFSLQQENNRTYLTTHAWHLWFLYVYRNISAWDVDKRRIWIKFGKYGSLVTFIVINDNYSWITWALNFVYIDFCLIREM